MPVQFRATEATEAAAWPSDDWWRGFHSPELNALIEQARAQNFDIAAAIARMRQADAQVRIAGAPLLPTTNATGNASWQHPASSASSGSTTGTTFVSGRAARRPRSTSHFYDFAPERRLRGRFLGPQPRRPQSAMASAVFSRFDQQTVALTVVTNVANTWFTALALADRLAVAQRNLADAEQTLAVIRGRLDAGHRQRARRRPAGSAGGRLSRPTSPTCATSSSRS